MVVFLFAILSLKNSLEFLVIAYSQVFQRKDRNICSTPQFNSCYNSGMNALHLDSLSPPLRARLLLFVVEFGGELACSRSEVTNNQSGGLFPAPRYQNHILAVPASLLANLRDTKLKVERVLPVFPPHSMVAFSTFRSPRIHQDNFGSPTDHVLK